MSQNTPFAYDVILSHHHADQPRVRRLKREGITSQQTPYAIRTK